MRPWHEGIDPASIPDHVISSENGKRNALKRLTYSGGSTWKHHNPDTSRCRCARCAAKRNPPIAASKRPGPGAGDAVAAALDYARRIRQGQAGRRKPK